MRIALSKLDFVKALLLVNRTLARVLHKMCNPKCCAYHDSTSYSNHLGIASHSDGCSSGIDHYAALAVAAGCAVDTSL